MARNPRKPKSPAQIKAQGLEAETILKNPAFIEAMDAVRETYKQAMVDTLPEQSDRRDHFHRCIHALGDVENALTALVNRGNLQKEMENKVRLTKTPNQKARK